MDAVADILLRLFPIVVGYVVLNALLSNVYKLSGGHWRTLALAYPMPEGRHFAGPSIFRFFEMVEFFEGEGESKVQSWWMIARIYPDGVALYMPPIPMIGYPPIFIPLSDLRVERRPWRDRGDACAISHRAPAIAIMIGDTLADMIDALRAQTAAVASPQT